MRFTALLLSGFLWLGCAYLPAPAPDWIHGETAVAKRGVVALGEAPAASGIAGADMVAAAQLAGALDAWLQPALEPLGPDLSKEIYVRVALVAVVSDRWVDPADGSHFSRVALAWGDVDKVLRRALHGDERLEGILEALPRTLSEEIALTPRAPDWMQLKWAQVPQDLQRRLPLGHAPEVKSDLAVGESKEDKEDEELDLDLKTMDLGGQVLPPAQAASEKEAPKPPPREKVEPKKAPPGQIKAKQVSPKKSVPKKAKPAASDEKKKTLIKRKTKPEDDGPAAKKKKAPPESKGKPEAKKEN